MVKEVEDIGLTLNASKCEIITRDHTTFGTILTLLPVAHTTLGTILTSLPGDHKVDHAYATLLGSPLGDGRCISKAIC